TVSNSPARYNARSRKTWQIEPVGVGALDRGVIAGIGMTHDAARRVVPQDTFEAARGFLRSVGDDHHAGMLGVADADAAAMVQRPRGGPARTMAQRIEKRPGGPRARAIAHRLGLAVRTSHRAAVEMIAADHDRRLQLAARHHLVERQAQPVAIAET